MPWALSCFQSTVSSYRHLPTLIFKLSATFQACKASLPSKQMDISNSTSSAGADVLQPTLQSN